MSVKQSPWHNDCQIAQSSKQELEPVQQHNVKIGNLLHKVVSSVWVSCDTNQQTWVLFCCYQLPAWQHSLDYAVSPDMCQPGKEQPPRPVTMCLMLPYLGSSDLGTEVALFFCDSRLGCRAETVPLDESIQHGLGGHGTLGEGSLPEGMLAHGLPGQPGGRVLV